MPYPRPPYLPGHYYHFYNRGRSRLRIFLEEDNYRFVLRKIQYYLALLEVSMIAVLPPAQSLPLPGAAGR